MNRPNASVVVLLTTTPPVVRQTDLGRLQRLALGVVGDGARDVGVCSATCDVAASRRRKREGRSMPYDSRRHERSKTERYGERRENAATNRAMRH